MVNQVHDNPLSTHDLSQRSTQRLHYLKVANPFQLTTSRRGRRFFFSAGRQFEPFNSRPHAEVDGRRFYTKCIRKTFNSRPHAEVDGAGRLCGHAGGAFNSRPHAEVDGERLSGPGRGRSFNSRPLAEVDTASSLPEGSESLSTHDLTQRSTKDISRANKTRVFQLTTSRRGRHVLRTSWIIPAAFQLTTSRRGRPG